MSVFGVATTIAPIVVPDDAIGFATASVAPVLVGRRELEGDRLPDVPVDRLLRQRAQAGDLVGEQAEPRAEQVDPVAGRLLEGLAGERRRLLVAALISVGGVDRLRIQLGDPVRLAVQLRERLVLGELLEEADRDRRRDHAREDDPREEDERQPDA